MKDELRKKTARRYNESEKQEILRFVQKVNSEKGRGGVTAAVKKFGISPITVNSWMKSRRDEWFSVPLAKTASQVEVFQRLAELHSNIEAKQSELDEMQKEYDALKSRIK